MSDKIVPLRVIPAEEMRGAANGEAIEMLERALVRVRLGEMQSVALVMAYADGSVETAWAQRSQIHHLTSGAASLLQRLASGKE
jgi:hypothetical protein